MPPSTQFASAHGANAKLEPPEEILQAVVIADSFDQRFMPLTLDLPRCLIPLCNTPLIDYTLEFLALADVKEVFIVCVSHHQLIREYILKSHWDKESAPMKIYVIVCKDSISVGDVLRELDNKALIKSDFVLVHGDVVSNLNLEPVLQRHRQRRKEDPNCLMTMVLKQGHVAHRAQGLGSVFLMDPKTMRCLHYLHQVHPVYLPPELFVHRSMELRHDLIDCGIDLCAPEVLALFSENFDYQDLRKHFVRGLLESDLFTKHIYVHLLEQDYALRVKSTHAYDCVAQDMMSRWIYPVVPEANVQVSSEPTYQYARHNVYRQPPVVLARTASLAKNVVLGQHSQVGEGTAIQNCVLGRRCRVGHHVALEHTYVWDRCTIGDECAVAYSILAEDVVLGDRVVLNRGCILGKGVKVDVGIVLPAHTKLMVPRNGVHSDLALVGPHGIGCRWQPHLDDEYGLDDSEHEHEEEGHTGTELAWVHEIGTDPLSTLDQHFAQLSLLSSSTADDSTDYAHLTQSSSFLRSNGPTRPNITVTSPHSAISSVRSRPHSRKEPETALKGANTATDWDTNSEEIQLTLLRALEQEHTLENTLLELNTLKFACNVTFADLRQEVVPCLLQHVFQKCGVNNMVLLKSQLEKWLPVVKGLVHRRVKDQWHVLQLMTTFFRTCFTPWSKKFGLVAMVCYDIELIEENVFLKFYATQQQQQQQQNSDDIVTKGLAPFIQWLREADEEEEEEGGEEECESKVQLAQKPTRSQPLSLPKFPPVSGLEPSGHLSNTHQITSSSGSSEELEDDDDVYDDDEDDEDLDEDYGTDDENENVDARR